MVVFPSILQSHEPKTLDLIGRHHTVEQVIDSFHLAREVGFATINMDLIVGLPGEHMEDVEHTMSVIKELDPDNLTVHSLAIKRSARLNLEWDKYQDLHMENSEKHMALAHRTAQALGMEPYYLYLPEEYDRKSGKHWLCQGRQGWTLQYTHHGGEAVDRGAWGRSSLQMCE